MAMSLEEFLEAWNNASDYVEVQTSGSTGTPKLMQVEKRRMLNSARITCDFLGLKPGDTALLCMSLDYIAGKMMVVRALERGLKLIVQDPSGHPMADVISGTGHFVSFAAMGVNPAPVSHTFKFHTTFQQHGGKRHNHLVQYNRIDIGIRRGEDTPWR